MLPFLKSARTIATSLLDYEQMNTDIKLLSGFWIEDIVQMLKAGWTLQPPKEPSNLADLDRLAGGDEDGK